MNRKYIAWLYEQWPDLVGREIVTAEAAEKLRQHYGGAGGRTRTRTRWCESGMGMRRWKTSSSPISQSLITSTMTETNGAALASGPM